VSNSVPEPRRRTHRTRRDIARVSAVVVAIAAAGAASVVTAFAHHIVSTTPTPTVGVVGKTALADTALVDADSSRHIAFSLWAPNTCGTSGASPVFTDSEPVTTAALTNSTVTSASYVPTQTGVYEWTAEVIVNADGSIENGPTACTDEQVTVNKIADHINTTPSNADGSAAGTGLTDSATLTGGDNPTGTVTFYLYGPSNTNCSNGDDSSQTWLQRWVVPVNGDGQAAVPAPGYATTAIGTYNWVADYSGDNDNMPAHSGCGSESVVVTKASPTIVTTASTGGPVGTQIHDTAQVSGGANPTGTVTFFLYAPNDQTCTNNENEGFVQKVVVPLGANGSASSASKPYTTTDVGIYNWVATYSGDANNTSATTACTDEQVTVGKDPTSVATVASSGGVVGTVIHDSAKVTGTFLPTGTVTFSLYGPTATTCTGTPIFSSTETLDATGSAVSGSYTLTKTAGTYNWVASYSGDSHSAPSTSKCGAESVVIKPASGVQGITTPGTGLSGGITQVGIGVELLLGGLALALGGELAREVRRR
jgi:hypothetical protein